MRYWIVAAAVVVAVIASIIAPPRLRLVWNSTASSPIGLYVITQAVPKRGDLVLIRLAPGMEALAVSRGILLTNTPVLKPVAAVAGDHICRSGPVVTINGRLAAIARGLDRQGNRLPIWRGCRRLTHSQILVLARHPDSFDGRYWGPLDARLASGVAQPLLTFLK